MKEWTFKVFVENGYCDFVEEWEKRLPTKAKAKMHWLITEMQKIKDWTQTKYFRPLTNTEGICELRFQVGNAQYRPLGCFGPDDGCFTLLMGAKEVGGNIIPKTAIWTATKRKVMIGKDRRHVDEYY